MLMLIIKFWKQKIILSLSSIHVNITYFYNSLFGPISESSGTPEQNEGVQTGFKCLKNKNGKTLETLKWSNTSI